MSHMGTVAAENVHISDVRVDQYCCHGERQSDDDISDRLCMLGSCTYYRQPSIGTNQ